MKTGNVISVDFNLINKYFGKERETLMEMKLSEILFLMEESSTMKEEDSIGFKLVNKIPIWKKFYKNYQSFLDLGFTEEELNFGMATLGSDYTFFEKISVHKGRKPHNYYYEFMSTGTASFPVPRTRSGKTETLPADFYNVSQEQFIGSFNGKLFNFLINKRLPFLLNYKFEVYSLDFYNDYNKDVYIRLNKGDLYVPILALMTLDTSIIVNRMVDYFDKSTKHSYGKSEDFLNDNIAIEFFNDINSYKLKMEENKNGN